MNFTATTIEDLLEQDISTLEKMSDAELEAFFEQALKISPHVQMMEPVGDAETRQKVSLVGVRAKGLKKQTTSKFTLEPQSKLAKEMSKEDKAAALKQQLSAFDNLLKGL